MKKILIVNDNLNLGGIQKALLNALCLAPQDEYDITLLLFNDNGTLIKKLPKNIKLITAGKRYSVLGKTKTELKKDKKLFIVKATLTMWAKLFHRGSAMKILGIGKKKLTDFDYAISYAHPFHGRYFSGGAAEFVLSKVEAKKKICFVHCDYLSAGTKCNYNDKLFSRFDKIACVSDSVKARFLMTLPNLSKKTITVRNSIIKEKIEALSNIDTFSYDNNFINLLTVARLSKEKGIERALNALADSKREDIRYYIIGAGPEEDYLKNLTIEKGVTKQVFFMGEKVNPYAYMKNADYLLVPSYHEAAPLVFDEAKCLGLKIITTDTVSAKELVGTDYGIVCENEDSALRNVLTLLKK